MDILPSTYAVAVTLATLSIPQNALHLDAVDNLLVRYGVLSELARTGAIAIVFVTIIGALERKFLLECWKKFRL